ncbi:MAG: hypothetical protein LBM28_05295 [Oscillospiraceae bacterium]|jgi:phenylacetate-CoA ligase|nr:hypothetical protein [Oscillospiraceae bacterium]
MNLMKLYNRVPIFMQNIFTTAQGYLYKKERFGKVYYATLEELRARNYGDLQELREYQDALFTELVRHAAENSPFYREFYKNIDLSQVRTVADIEKLPRLPKETVRRNLPQMYTVAPESAIKSETGGTTGTAMRFYYTKRDRQRRMAYLDFFKMRHGFVPMKMRRASFNSSRIVPATQKAKVFWRTNRAIKQRIYSAFHVKNNNLRYYVENLNKFKPHSIDGYPSAIFEVANYILENNICLDFKPVAIFPTAETLLPHYREAMEKAFGCPVRDQYASSEGAPFIVECTAGRLHYCMDNGVIEFNADGQMLVSCFDTHATPLIRYEIGDKAFLAEEQSCACGCKMPVVDHIEGRVIDYVLTRSRGRFPAVFLSCKGVPGVRYAQFVQDRVDALLVKLVATEGSNHAETEKAIRKKFQYFLGEDMDIQVRFVEDVEKEPSGKFRYIINNVK